MHNFLLLKLPKSNWGKFSLVIPIITFIAVVIMVVQAYPEIDIRMHFTENTSLTNTQNIMTKIERNDVSSYGTKICFDIKNTAQKNSAVSLPANNVLISIQTDDAICTDCDADTILESLEAQETTEVCRVMKAPKDAEQIHLKITPKYDAPIFYWEPKTEFTCKLIEPEQTRNHYNCGLTYKEFLGIKGFS